MQSSVTKGLLHVGVIMDGNGRWATGRGLPRLAGHRQGAKAVRRTVEAAPDLGISILTLFAFSADNWLRPAPEVEGLMDLFEEFLSRERRELIDKGVRVEIIGRRDRLRPHIVNRIERLELETAEGTALCLRLAVDYSARWAITQAATTLSRMASPDPLLFREQLQRVQHSSPQVPDLDLLIRTSGEQRLSDFLLWESAYAELYFTDTLWPDFDAPDLARAVDVFRRRDRRFGRLQAIREMAS
ncbi:MAG: polyprenyl diphosphate synthase [Acidobacteriota bacterium]|nr:polyprenyl diphosphate synthase [Acidobacteriota bacterium]